MGRVAGVVIVLAYGIAVGWLSPRALTWDGIAFLDGVRAGTIDLGHALYLPLLRGANALAGGQAELVARWFSAVGGAGAFLLVWLSAERAGAAPLHALGCGALFALAALVWQEAGSIEPTTWTCVALLASGELARAYSRERSWGHLLGLVAACGAAVGFHLVSLCALPWLAARATRGGSVPRAHLAVPLGAAAVVLGAALAGGELGRYLRYWSGFVPSYAGGAASELARHLERGGRLFLEGAPVLVVAGSAAALLLRSRARASADAAWLAGPFLAAFLVLGKPLVALLVPVMLACALLAGEAACVARERGAGRAVGAGLGLAIGIELALVVPQAVAWSRAPDLDRARAELVVRYLPEGALLFAGKLANHLRHYHPEVEVVSLPELLHGTFARDRSADPVEVVQRAVDAASQRCVLSSDGAVFLRDVGADPARLGLSLGQAFPVPEDPKLLLFPLRARRP